MSDDVLNRLEQAVREIYQDTGVMVHEMSLEWADVSVVSRERRMITRMQATISSSGRRTPATRGVADG